MAMLMLVLLLVRFDLGSADKAVKKSPPTDWMKCERKPTPASPSGLIYCELIVYDEHDNGNDDNDKNEKEATEHTKRLRSCYATNDSETPTECVDVSLSTVLQSNDENIIPETLQKPPPRATAVMEPHESTTETNTEEESFSSSSSAPKEPPRLATDNDKVWEKPQQALEQQRRDAGMGPIVVGKASYRPPYREQYGIVVGEVLHDFYARGFSTKNSRPSVLLVDWYLNLGNAHLDDAQVGVEMDPGGNPNLNDHPKHYHIELALQAYAVASQTLFALTSETEFTLMDVATVDCKETMLELQYYAILEFSKGEANTVAQGDSQNRPTPEDEVYRSSALEHYRKAQTAYEKLRYLYAKLAAAAATASSASRASSSLIPTYYYFNDERYYMIENLYGHSCYHLGVSLYSQLIITQNEQVIASNEKIMEMVKSQFGMEGELDDIVTQLMDQAIGGMGLGGGGGGVGGGGAFSSFSMDSLGGVDLSEILGATGGMMGGNDEAFNAKLVEVAALLDTAILTYQQHADHPSTKEKPMRVLLNGVPRKTPKERAEEERLFVWRSSLALAYENAATIATTRNHHIRSRELMNSALELYTDVILSYYKEKALRAEKQPGGTSQNKNMYSGRHHYKGGGSDIFPTSAMTRGYAENSAGNLYVSLANTEYNLGNYASSIQAYSKAMDWHMQHKLAPMADGYYNSLAGDEVSRRQYEDLIRTYQQELDQYLENVRKGFFFPDDLTEAALHFTIAPLYMAMGRAGLAIRYYKDAIDCYERVTANLGKNFKNLDASNKMSVLGMADCRYGLAGAYFHAHWYTDAKEEYAKALYIFEKVYGEGTPPQADNQAVLEDMKDTIIESYGKEYYDQLKSYYDSAGSGSTGMGGGFGTGEGGHNTMNPTVVATNFDAFGYDNETASEYDYEDIVTVPIPDLNDNEADPEEPFTDDEL